MPYDPVTKALIDGTAEDPSDVLGDGAPLGFGLGAADVLKRMPAARRAKLDALTTLNEEQIGSLGRQAATGGDPLALLSAIATGVSRGIPPGTIVGAAQQARADAAASQLDYALDIETHQQARARIDNQEARLAFDALRLDVEQGNKGSEALYKTLVSVGQDLPPERANAWLQDLLTRKDTYDVRNPGAAQRFAFESLQRVGGFADRPPEPKAPGADPLQQVFDPNSPTGATLVPRSQAAGLPAPAKAGGVEISYDEEGRPQVTIGQRQKPLTESEAKNTGFLNRMQLGEQQIGKFMDENPEYLASGRATTDQLAREVATGVKSIPVVGGAIGGILGSVERLVTSPQGKQYASASAPFVNAALRKDTGAAITNEEWGYAFREWLPLPGDDETTIATKARNRQAALEAAQVGAGAGAERLGNRSQPAAPRSTSSAPAASASPSGPRRWRWTPGGVERVR